MQLFGQDDTDKQPLIPPRPLQRIAKKLVFRSIRVQRGVFQEQTVAI